MNIVNVTMADSHRPIPFDAGSLVLKRGDTVVVEGERGPMIAVVSSQYQPEAAPAEQLPRVMRTATTDDIARRDRYRDEQVLAFRYCREQIQRRELEMKLVSVESVFDGSRMIFFFTAEQRVDFRDLVRELAHRFRTRIEMIQIGVRDAAKKLGGYDVCGRPLCCSTFLTGFEPVTIKMAKDQNLAMNPSKVSGVCGRLKCCLRYEHDLYTSFSKGLPKVGKRCETADGRVGRVNRHDPIQNVVLVRLDASDEMVALPPDQVRRITPRNDEVKKAGEGERWNPVIFQNDNKPEAAEEAEDKDETTTIIVDPDLPRD